MEKFVVSARKYRPQNFATVVGQSHITTTLKNAILHNQLAHAFLFCGPRGVGKTTCARILAKTINCETRTKEGEACNTCNSCVSFDAGASLNIHELDAASNNSVDDIRNLVEQVRFAPQAGKYKVYIVDEVHMLSTSAFNAFLKTLEEPPPYAIFILATTEKHKILPTILSRCQIFDFKRITPFDTVEHLQEIADKENITAEKEALHVIAQKSEGCMRDALSILDKIVSFTGGALTYANTLEHLNILDADYYFKLLDILQKQDLAGAMLLYDEINRKGFEGDLVINSFAEFIRNLLVSKNEKAASLLEVTDSMRKKFADTAKACNMSYLLSALNILGETELNYRMARNKRLHVELALIKLTYLGQAIDLASNGETLLKKKRVDGPVPYKRKDLAPMVVKEPVVTTSIVSEPNSSKLYIEEKKPVIKTPLPPPPIVQQKIDPQPVSSLKVSATASTKTTKGNLLQQITQKHIIAASQENTIVAKTLLLADLQIAWNKFADDLNVQQKYSVATNFKQAQLQVVDNNNINILTANEIQQKFIEQERVSLLEYLQETFHNKALLFNLVVDASLNEIDEATNDHKATLSSRDRFDLLVKANPLIKDLKDGLKLELDY
jgi:DNA polymerase III subunit gamma/tau